MGDNVLFKCLREANLESYYQKFVSYGVNHSEKLTQISMKDFPSFGVKNSADQKKLFQLIQIISDLQMPENNSPNDSSFLKSEYEDETTRETIRHDGYNYGIPGDKSARQRSPSNSRLHSDRIKVCVRKRPMINKEKQDDKDVVFISDTCLVTVSEEKSAVDLTKYIHEHEFMFDEAFKESESNQSIYNRAVKDLISHVVDGGTATCFAYGQTGSGKTYTVLGNEQSPGLYVMSAKDIFDLISSNISVYVSYYEIYCGQLYDLLNGKTKLQVREDGKQKVHISGLREVKIKNVRKLLEVVQIGSQSRSTGISGVNPDSSRSHAVLQIQLKANKMTKGLLNFIDLAGSERAADSGEQNKQTRHEGAEINTSLLALKECIRSIDQFSKHTPFRQSKLTQVLKDCFLGNSKTCMIANISPTYSSCDHTLNTLRYADRVKELKKQITVRSKITANKSFHEPSYAKKSKSTKSLHRSKSDVSLSKRSNNELTQSNSFDDSCVGITPRRNIPIPSSQQKVLLAQGISKHSNENLSDSHQFISYSSPELRKGTENSPLSQSPQKEHGFGSRLSNIPPGKRDHDNILRKLQASASRQSTAISSQHPVKPFKTSREKIVSDENLNEDLYSNIEEADNSEDNIFRKDITFENDCDSCSASPTKSKHYPRPPPGKKEQRRSSSSSSPTFGSVMSKKMNLSEFTKSPPVRLKTGSNESITPTMGVAACEASPPTSDRRSDQDVDTDDDFNDSSPLLRTQSLKAVRSKTSNESKRSRSHSPPLPTQFVDLNKARSGLITHHKEQLGEISKLCNRELQLLHSLEKGDRSFNQYVKSVHELLSRKLKTIERMKVHLIEYNKIISGADVS